MRTSSKYLRISKYSLPIKFLRTSWNICAYPKIFAPMKYSRPWNIRAHEIFAPMKCSRPWNVCAYPKYLRIHKIYASHQECSRLIIYDSNKAAVEIFAAYKRYMPPQMWAPKLLLFGLGRISNFWLLLSLSEELSFRWCCLSSMQSSSGDLLSDRPAYRVASLPYCTGLLYRHDLPKYSSPIKCSRPRIFPPFFWEKSKT